MNVHPEFGSHNICLLNIFSNLYFFEGASSMAGRAAIAVKSKIKSKPRTAAKATTAKKVKSEKSSTTATTISTASASGSKAEAVSSDSQEKPTRTRRRTKQETRTRIYWAVFNQNLKRVAVFEFDQKTEAEKRASKLMDHSGDHHFIQKIKVMV